jgi:hypothetical protein
VGNVGNFKARITLETEEYLASWKKVEAATTNATSGLGKSFEKAAKSWGNSVQKAIVGIFGIQLADTLVKSIDARLQDPIFEGMGANIAYAVGEGFQKTLESVPVASTVGKWIGAGLGAASDYVGLTNDASGAQEARQQASREVAARNEEARKAIAAITTQMERQTNLSAAMDDTERTRLEREYKFQDIAKQINDAMMKAGRSGPEIMAERDRVKAIFDAQNAAADKLAASKAAQLEAEKAIAAQQEEQARIQKEAADAAEAAAARAEARQRAEERAQEQAFDFLDGLQRQLDERTMTEDQLFQRKLDELGLDDQQIAKAWELHNALKAAEEAQAGIAEGAEITAEATKAMANVESLSTAVGGVKVAGVSSGLDKLADPAKATATNTAKLVEIANQQRLAEAAP